MRKSERLGYDPGPVGESYTRLGPLTRDAAAAPDHAHSVANAPMQRRPNKEGSTRPARRDGL